MDATLLEGLLEDLALTWLVQTSVKRCFTIIQNHLALRSLKRKAGNVLSCAGCVVHCHWRLTRTTQGATTAHCLDGGGRDGSNDKDAVIEEEGVDKDSLTEEAMVAAVATPSAG
jgi:hypothetical protein